jgi:integrase
MRRCNWQVFSRDVLALYAAPMRRPATYRKMRQTLREFGELVQRPPDLSPATIATWITAHPGRRPDTVQALLRSLSAACSYGVRWGYLQTNPFEFRSSRKWVDWAVPELDPPVHSAEEIARALARADLEASAGSWKAQRLRALIYAYAYLGARKREVLGLRVEDIDVYHRVIDLKPNARRPLKTRRSAAHLPIPEPLAHVLESWLPQTQSAWAFPGVRRIGPWLDGAPGLKAIDEIEALGLRAGVPHLTIASFRHTFASLSESWDIGELALQRVLRHTRIRTQRSYRHELPQLLRDVAAKVHFP